MIGDNDPVVALYGAIDRFMRATSARADLMSAREHAARLSSDLAVAMQDAREHRALAKQLDLALASCNSIRTDVACGLVGLPVTRTNQLKLDRAMALIGWSASRSGYRRNHVTR